MNYGQTEFDILPKLVPNQNMRHIESIYVDQVRVASTQTMIYID